MNRTRLIIIGILAAVPLLGFALSAHAQSFRTGDNITVPKDRTVNSTLFAGGKNIDIAGTVNGDVFCGGQNITISGTVNGDVMCAGQDIHITGKVQGDVRVAGQNISLNNSIGNNLTAAGQNLTLDSSSSVGGDASFAGQDITINGSIARDLAAGSGTVNVNAAVGRNIKANVEHLRLQSGASVGGNIEYTSQNRLSRDSNAKVLGTVSQKKPDNKANKDHIWWVTPLFALILLAVMLFTSVVLALLIPRTFHNATTNARASLGKTLLIGFIASIIVPALIVLLLVSLIGIPLGLLLLLVWGVILFLSGPFAAYLFGRLILQSKATNAILIMFVGALVLLLLYTLPILGFIVMLFAVWFGTGTILRYITVRKPHYTYAVEPAAAAPAKNPSNNTEEQK